MVAAKFNGSFELRGGNMGAVAPQDKTMYHTSVRFVPPLSLVYQHHLSHFDRAVCSNSSAFLSFHECKITERAILFVGSTGSDRSPAGFVIRDPRRPTEAISHRPLQAR